MTHLCACSPPSWKGQHIYRLESMTDHVGGGVTYHLACMCGKTKDEYEAPAPETETTVGDALAFNAYLRRERSDGRGV